MKNLPNIAKFFFLFVAVYITLSILHLLGPVKTVHSAVFNETQQLVFNIAHPTVRTNFKQYDAVASGQKGNQDLFDFSIMIYAKDQWKMASNKRLVQPKFILNQSIKLASLGPFVLLLSLLLVSPSTWKKKLIALFVGSMLLSLVLAMKYTYLIDQNAPHLTKDGFSLWMSISKTVGNALRTNEANLIVVVPIWIASVIGKKELEWFTS